MQCKHQREDDGTYLFGEKSKLANWLLNHPFHIVGSGVLICSLVTIPDWVMLVRSLWIDAFLFAFALLFRLLLRNLCFWIVIDTRSENIRFFRCFNKGVVEASLRSVEFVFDKHFAASYAGQRFTILNEYMGPIADVLPFGMEIQFSNHFYGRFMKRQFEKQRYRKE